MYMTEIKSLQGQLFLAPINPTTLQAYQWDWIGDVSDVTAKPSRDFEEFIESFSGLSMVEHRWPTKSELTLDLTMNHLVLDNLTLGLSGTRNNITGDDVVGEILNNHLALVPGKYYALEHGGATITDLVIKDSSATPKVLTLGTHYMANLAFGSLQVLALPAGTTAPFKADYTFATYSGTSILDALPPERSILLQLVNVPLRNSMLVKFYRAQFPPADELAMIKKSRAELKMSPKILADFSKWNSADWYSAFGRIVS
jgi:hypothetical protein